MGTAHPPVSGPRAEAVQQIRYRRSAENVTETEYNVRRGVGDQAGAGISLQTSIRSRLRAGRLRPQVGIDDPTGSLPPLGVSFAE